MSIEIAEHLQQFVDDQVRTGRFKDAAAVIEAALDRMMDEFPLAAETISAVDVGVMASLDKLEAEADAGPLLEWADVEAKLRTKFLPH